MAVAATATTAIDRFAEVDTTAEVLAVALGKATNRSELQQLAADLALVCERLSAERVTAVYGRAAEGLAAALTKAPGSAEGQRAFGTGLDALPRLAEWLALVCEQLPVERAAEVCEPVAAALAVALAVARDNATDRSQTRNLTECLAEVCRALPAERGAEILVAALEKADVSERWELTLGLAEVSRRLPADKAAAVCGREAEALVAALEKMKPPAGTDTWRSGFSDNQRWTLVYGLAKVCGRLPAERAAEVLITALEKAMGVSERRALAIGLEEECGRLPADKAAAVCGRAVEALAPALEKAKDEHERLLLAACLAQVCERLPAERSAGILVTALEKATGGSDRMQLGESLAAVCERLPVEQAAEMCGPAALALAAALEKETRGVEQAQIAFGLAAVCGRLPAERTAEVCGPAAQALAAALGAAPGEPQRQPRVPGQKQSERGRLTTVLVEVCWCLPAKRAVEVLTAVLEKATGEEEWGVLAEGLVAVASGLPQGKLLHNKHSNEVTGLAGVVTLHAVRPKPCLLTPQQMVDLLKHPFCVGPTRGDVVDVLGLTYDRQFKDLWEFIAFAEKEHPELDLLTPPKRPTN